jgi:hypothetical protein
MNEYERITSREAGKQTDFTWGNWPKKKRGSSLTVQLDANWTASKWEPFRYESAEKWM